MQDSLLAKEDCYQIFGTLKNESSVKPEWVKRILEVGLKFFLLMKTFCQWEIACTRVRLKINFYYLDLDINTSHPCF